jgi:NitT/TauT family transport system ATP-binding protein
MADGGHRMMPSPPDHDDGCARAYRNGSNGTALVSLRDVTRRYGTDTESVLALSSVSFDINAREFVTVLGPSGCGKTTILNMIAGFDAPSSGSVSMEGTPISGPSAMRGVVFQDSAALFPWMTVAENISFGLRAAWSSRSEVRQRVDAVLKLVRLSDFANKFPMQLSGGMRQLVAIARVLVMDTKLLLMDEPFAALDAITRQRLQEQLVDIWQRAGAAILFITHSIDEAMFLGDRVIVMSGRPGSIRATFDIDLPRPRDVTSVAFNELKARALALLR